MPADLKPVLMKSLATTLLAVLGALGAFAISRWLTGTPYDSLDLIECIIIPVVVGFPIAFYVFTQSVKLRDAHAQLQALNAETEDAYARLRQAYEVIAFSSRHDRMTGVYNREHFLALLNSAFAAGDESVFLIVDADRFKRINDTFGHAKGDEALILIAEALKRTVRADDLVGRLGGEEFGILVRRLGVAGAADMAEKVRLAVASIEWAPDNGESYQLSVSVGGAAFGDFSGVTEVLLQADKCLYEAKASGRNRIAFNYSLSNLAYVRAKARTGSSNRPLEAKR
jgi:diguanylate cyclase (GGDEF)-like protein